MLARTYEANGFPVGTHGERFFISRRHGLPVHPKDRVPSMSLITPRHGLKHPIETYKVTQTDKGALVAISDKEATRFYFFDRTFLTLERTDTSYRNSLGYFTLLVDQPSPTYEAGWENLFRGLLTGTTGPLTTFYSKVSKIFAEHFQKEGRTREFIVEGRHEGTEYKVSIYWEPFYPTGVRVEVNNYFGDPVLIGLATHPVLLTMRVMKCRAQVAEA